MLTLRRVGYGQECQIWAGVSGMGRSVVVGRRVAHGQKCGYEHGREVWTKVWLWAELRMVARTR